MDNSRATTRKINLFTAKEQCPIRKSATFAVSFCLFTTHCQPVGSDKKKNNVPFSELT